MIDRLILEVYFQDGLAVFSFRQHDVGTTVETARTKQGRIEDVGAVRRRQDDNVRTCLESIHLYQYLVQRLLALIMTTAHAGATLASDGIDLVDENDGRRVLFCLGEQIAHAAGTDTDEHLDEFRTGDTEERHIGFAGDRPG